jgi:hypothetical protein
MDQPYDMPNTALVRHRGRLPRSRCTATPGHNTGDVHGRRQVLLGHFGGALALYLYC